MQFSHRALGLNESLTLKLNAQASVMKKEGKEVINLTAGQLPFRPHSDYVEALKKECDFLASFQYSPVPGFVELKSKVISHFESSRDVKLPEGFQSQICTGGKQALNNVLACLINPGDEVITFAPYWVSYPEMIRLYEGVPVVVGSGHYNEFVPDLEEIEQKINSKTKLLILNSPNNPAGIHYPKNWMENLGELLKKHPDLILISDEIYFHLNYYDPEPSYPYQKFPEILERTIIVDGASKSLALTGLRLGWAIGPQKLISLMGKLQGQTTSGANSLCQKALLQFSFEQIDSFLGPIKKHLRINIELLGQKLRDYKLSHLFYQSRSAFYFLIDFSQTPLMESLKSQHPDQADFDMLICEKLLNEKGVAVVPGSAFGLPNTARLSLVNEKVEFEEAIDRICQTLSS